MALAISEQLRAARALLRWQQADLAAKSGVSLPTIKRVESEPGPLKVRAETYEKLRSALEDAGIEFSNGDRPGVRLKG